MCVEVLLCFPHARDHARIRISVAGTNSGRFFFLSTKLPSLYGGLKEEDESCLWYIASSRVARPTYLYRHFFSSVGFATAGKKNWVRWRIASDSEASSLQQDGGGKRCFEVCSSSSSRRGGEGGGRTSYISSAATGFKGSLLSRPRPHIQISYTTFLYILLYVLYVRYSTACVQKNAISPHI